MFCYLTKFMKPWTYFECNRKYLFHLYSPHSYLLRFTMGHMLPVINASSSIYMYVLLKSYIDCLGTLRMFYP